MAKPYDSTLKFLLDTFPVIQERDKMKESSTYQAILEEGRLEEARRILVTLGTDAFGAPDAAAWARIEATADYERLEDWIRRLRTASGWADLLVAE